MNPYEGLATFTRAEQLRVCQSKQARSPANDMQDALRRVVEAILPSEMALPPFDHHELYLVRGLNTISGPSKQIVVAFPPEFLFVLDVGYPSRIGVSVPWEPSKLGFGDPDFPDFSKASVRSVSGSDQSQLIFPDVSGELILGLDISVPPADVKDALTREGLWDVDLAGSFALARCKPFHERSICKHLELKLPFIRYAEPNHVVRVIDIIPGWRIDRLA